MISVVIKTVKLSASLKELKKLLADAFENFRKMCLEIYELDPAKFISAPRLAWQAFLK